MEPQSQAQVITEFKYSDKLEALIISRTRYNMKSVMDTFTQVEAFYVELERLIRYDHRVKIVCILSFFDPYFLPFRLNKEICKVNLLFSLNTGKNRPVKLRIQTHFA